MSDDGAAIVSSTVAAVRERGALLPAIDTIERIGLAGACHSPAAGRKNPD